MQINLQLYRNTDGEAEDFSTIDQKMCVHFGAQCDPNMYFRSWYESIGFALAFGDSFDDIIAEYQGCLNEVLAKKQTSKASYYKLKIMITEWLKDNYSKSWARMDDSYTDYRRDDDYMCICGHSKSEHYNFIHKICKQETCECLKFISMG